MKNDSSGFQTEASKDSATLTQVLGPLGPPAVILLKILEEMLILVPYLLL